MIPELRRGPTAFGAARPACRCANRYRRSPYASEF